MDKRILQRLKGSIVYMSEVEARIARLILSDPRSFVRYSLAKAATLAKVSQGSVVNFATKYTGNGYAHLKLCVAAALPDNTIPFSEIEAGDSATDILGKTVASVGTALSSTASLNDEETLRSVADRILRAKKVEIYGIYRSGVVANDFYYQLLQLGIPAAYVSDVLTCSVSASLLGEGSLVIAVSSSGQTQDIIDAVRLAKENGVPVVSLTAHRASPLAALSDEVLIAAPSGSSLSSSAVEIRHSQLVIADAICACVAQRLGKCGEERYIRASKLLSTHNVKE